MAERPIDQLTLREKFTHAEQLARELIDHVENGFIPKTARLHRLLARDEDTSGLDDESEDIDDSTVRSHISQILASEDFTEEVYGKLKKYLVAIDREVAKIVEE